MLSPTPKQYLRVAKRLHDYISGGYHPLQEAVNLDNVRSNRNPTSTPVSETQHRYLPAPTSPVHTIPTFHEAPKRRRKTEYQSPTSKTASPPPSYLTHTIPPRARLNSHTACSTSCLHHLAQVSFRSAPGWENLHPDSRMIHGGCTSSRRLPSSQWELVSAPYNPRTSRVMTYIPIPDGLLVSRSAAQVK